MTPTTAELRPAAGRPASPRGGPGGRTAAVILAFALLGGATPADAQGHLWATATLPPHVAAADGASMVAAGASDTAASVAPRKNALRTFGEIFGVNALVWSYDRFIRPGGGEGFRIGFNSWEENILNAWEWDDNNFNTNQFAHPYHGSLYFNAARSNGYDFWESIPWTFAGSIMWEYFGETHHPSMNDWVATSVGGVALGEMLYRASSLVLDNTATGSGRVWREIAGTAIAPTRGLTRMLSGEMFRQGPNPPDSRPPSSYVRLVGGARTAGQYRIWDSDTTRAFAEVGIYYGDLFKERERKPYDFFEVEGQLNFGGDKTTLGRIQSRGLLWSKQVAGTERTRHRVGVVHHFDYVNTFAYEWGSQSVSAALVSRFDAPGGAALFTGIYLNGVMLGATNSDHENFTGREYDYGPGLGYRLLALYSRDRRVLGYISHDHFWIDTMNGTRSDHYVTVSRARASVPIHDTMAAGAEYALYTSDSNYKDFADVYRRRPEVKLFVSWELR